MIKAIALSFLVAAAYADAACTLSEPLRDAAARRGKLFGTCLAQNHLSEQKYAMIAKQQFNIITAENECKWDAVEPRQGSFNFAPCDGIQKQATAYNQTFRGHCLCWGQQVPQWVTSLPKSQKKDALIKHVKGVASHYKNTNIGCWDVVNEAVADGSASLKNTVWYPDVPDFIDVAFKAAREADPKVKLFYNDYNADGVNQKSTYIYNMVKSMKQRGIPIDGVGLQMHVATNGYPSESDLRANIKRFGDLGLEVHFTETDVKCGGDFVSQAKVYETLMRACLLEKACTSFQVWGITDKYSWRAEEKPLIFDSNYNAKDAACSILKVLKS